MRKFLRTITLGALLASVGPGAVSAENVIQGGGPLPYLSAGEIAAGDPEPADWACGETNILLLAEREYSVTKSGSDKLQCLREAARECFEQLLVDADKGMQRPLCPGCYCTRCCATSCRPIFKFPQLREFIKETGWGVTEINGTVESCRVNCKRENFSYEAGCTQCMNGHTRGHPGGEIGKVESEPTYFEELCDPAPKLH